MNIVVFLGPSLPQVAATRILPTATFLPPARHTDVLSVLDSHHPDVIGLIDGAFEQSMSVWHKEILFAMERGVQVWGAASMGAIRAAELQPFGMHGVGTVFEYFSGGDLADDDEVAVLHGPSETGFQPVTEPMVNLRATFAGAHERGVLSATDADRLVAAAKRLHYAQRTLPTILQGARVAPTVAESVSTFFATDYVNVKAADAQLLLKHFASMAAIPPERGLAFSTTRSPSFRQMVANDRCVLRGSDSVSLQGIVQHAALEHPDFDSVNTAALNRALVQELAMQMHVSVDEQEIAYEHARFLRERGLTDSGLEQWLSANDITALDFARLMREQAICRRMRRWLLHTPRRTEHTRWILDELRLRGTYEDTAVNAARAATALDASPGRWDSLAELNSHALLDLLNRHRPGWSLSALSDWSQEAGFNDLKDLAYALLQSRHVRRTEKEMGNHDG